MFLSDVEEEEERSLFLEVDPFQVFLPQYLDAPRKKYEEYHLFLRPLLQIKVLSSFISQIKINTYDNIKNIGIII